MKKCNCKVTQETLVRDALVLAKMTQQRYDTIGAGAHQRVRNPFPMHQLVLTVLPTIKGAPADPNEVVARRTVRLTVFGKEIVRHIEVLASDVCGDVLSEKCGLSISEITDALEARGYIVTSEKKVGMALNVAARQHYPVGSIRCQRPSRNPTRVGLVSYKRYFMRG